MDRLQGNMPPTRDDAGFGSAGGRGEVLAVSGSPMGRAAKDAAVFLEAARLNQEDPLRKGSLLRAPKYGQFVMTGDIHGHERNFERLKKFADLRHAPGRHVLLHELIHSEPTPLDAADTSHRVMLDAARWKIEFPDQVHFIQSNHELSQLTGKQISKGGRIVNFDFERSLAVDYGDDARLVLDALTTHIASFPLAVRTENRIFLSHSLPNARDLPYFDPSVLNRTLQSEDLCEGGDAYLLVWGRQHTPELLEQLAKGFDVDLFICGHQPQEDGYEVVHDRLIILASDHNHGVFLPFDLRKSYTVQDLARLIRPFAAIE
ncbi:MAG: metallophosphoesterase [Planctomycetes bacterium]|nr:metallophosphoesterase [Planctomycetota bacterium]